MAKKSAKKVKEVAKKPKGRGEPVYAVMAFVTLVAMIVGCVLLYLDFEEYGKNSPPKESVPALPKLGDDLKGGAAAVAPTPTPPG